MHDLSQTQTPPHPGPVAQQLNLTHFVDTEDTNLETVSKLVGCQCFLFLRNGVGTLEAAAILSGSVSYPVLPNWDNLVQILLGP
jgi:hypothetical protein